MPDENHEEPPPVDEPFGFDWDDPFTMRARDAGGRRTPEKHDGARAIVKEHEEPFPGSGLD